jgi:uncharacterized damage-inducible protein DinB
MNYREAAELTAAAGLETVIFEENSEKPGYFVQEMYERFPSLNAMLWHAVKAMYTFRHLLL